MLFIFRLFFFFFPARRKQIPYASWAAIAPPHLPASERPGCQPLQADGDCKAQVPSTQPLLLPQPSAGVGRWGGRSGDRAGEGWAGRLGGTTLEREPSPAPSSAGPPGHLDGPALVAELVWERGEVTPSDNCQSLPSSSVSKPAAIPPPRKLSVKRRLCQASFCFKFNVCKVFWL